VHRSGALPGGILLGRSFCLQSGDGRFRALILGGSAIRASIQKSVQHGSKPGPNATVFALAAQHSIHFCFMDQRFVPLSR
jgi:hypothetical protein